MQITVTDEAIRSFQKEWGFQEGDSFRIFVRYVSGGKEPYALGIMRDTPIDPLYRENAGPFVVYVENSDSWYLQGKRLLIQTNEDGITWEVSENE